MKKTLIFLLLMTAGTILSGLDIQLKNGRVLKDFTGIGTVAAVPRTNYARWGVVIFYQNGARKTVVELKDFPNDFPYMRQVRKRAEQIPQARANAQKMLKERKAEEKEELERQKRLKKIAKDAKKGVPVNLPKATAKGTKKREWKSGD